MINRSNAVLETSSDPTIATPVHIANKIVEYITSQKYPVGKMSAMSPPTPKLTNNGSINPTTFNAELRICPMTKLSQLHHQILDPMIGISYSMHHLLSQYH